MSIGIVTDSDTFLTPAETSDDEETIENEERQMEKEVDVTFSASITCTLYDIYKLHVCTCTCTLCTALRSVVDIHVCNMVSCCNGICNVLYVVG